MDVDSRFILGMHSNFDDNVDPFAINREAARNGDMDRPEAFRRYAQYWLTGDELKAGRKLGDKLATRRKDLSRLPMLRNWL